MENRKIGFYFLFVILYLQIQISVCQENMLPIIEKVSFTTTDSIILNGTLYLPNGKIEKIIIMLTDVTFEVRNPDFLLAADSVLFISNFIKRSNKENVGVFMIGRRTTFEDESSKILTTQTNETLADDAENALNYIKSRDDLKSKIIGIFGSSETACSAAKLAARNKDISFLLLNSIPNIDGIKYYDFIFTPKNKGLNFQKFIEVLKILDQIVPKSFIYKGVKYDKDISANNLTKCFVDNLSTINQNIIKHHNNYDTIRHYATKLFHNEWEGTNFVASKKMVHGEEWSASQCINFLFKIWYSDRDIEFIKWDPAHYLTKITCQVLFLFGGKDLNIPVEESIYETHKIITQFGKTNFTLKVYPDLDHFFHKSGMDVTIVENDGKKHKINIVPNEVYDDIINWIKGFSEY